MIKKYDQIKGIKKSFRGLKLCTEKLKWIYIILGSIQRLFETIAVWAAEGVYINGPRCVYVWRVFVYAARGRLTFVCVLTCVYVLGAGMCVWCVYLYVYVWRVYVFGVCMCVFGVCMRMRVGRVFVYMCVRRLRWSPRWGEKENGYFLCPKISAVFSLRRWF